MDSYRMCPIKKDADFNKYRTLKAAEKECFSLKSGFSIEIAPLQKAFFHSKKCFRKRLVVPKNAKKASCKPKNRCQSVFSMCKKQE